MESQYNKTVNELQEVVTPEFVITSSLNELKGLPQTRRLVKVKGKLTNKTNRGTTGRGCLIGANPDMSLNLFFSIKEGNMVLFNELLPDTYYILNGYISFYHKNDSFYVQLIPISVDTDSYMSGIDGIRTVSQYSMLKEWLCDKRQNGRNDITRVVFDCLSKPKGCIVLLVRPKTNTARTDIISALGESEKFFHINDAECNFTNPEDIAMKIKVGSDMNVDLVILARGGGENLDIVDSTQVLEALHDLKKPLITGLGHANDHLLAELFADEICNTPTAVGTFLRDTYIRAKEKRDFTMEPVRTDETQTFYSRNKKEYEKSPYKRYISAPETFYGMKWTEMKWIRWFIKGLCLIGLYQLIRFFI